ncbi:MAG: alpha/beta hydrolase [Anaerolineales bacterium]|nr:alpha/beta hydrolase [Anaerolineales bacterium]
MLKTTVNGLELAYERRGRGTPLVLIHGYPLDHTIWNPVVPLLEADFDLILPDLRGFGQSSAVRTRYLLTDMAADIAALLDFLKIKTATIAGHSMGGYVALAFARCYPSRVRGLGLVASQAIADPPDRKAVRYQMADRVEANGVGEVAEFMPALLTADADLQAALKQLILRQPPEGVAGALRAMADRPASTDILSTFDFSVTIIHGLTDKIVPIERARDVRAAVKKGYLVEIEGVGHMPMMEAPQVTAEALNTLL